MKEYEFYENLLEIPGLKVTSVAYESRKITIDCQTDQNSAVCPHCGEPTGKVNQYEIREVRDLEISGKAVWLRLRIRQFMCPNCNRYFSESPEWIMPGKSYTRRQAKWVFEMCARQPFKEVGALVDMCDKTVERLYYEQAEAKVEASNRYANVKKLGIDEIAHKKGKEDFICVLTDLEKGTQLDILPDRKKSTIEAHFQSLGTDFCNQIEVVACDMWSTYRSVAEEMFPNAQVVADRFHIVKLLNDVVDVVRRRLRSEWQGDSDFKGLKWLLFKQPKNCSTEQLAILDKALNKSWLLSEIYEMRNTFHAMFETATCSENLAQQLDFWIEHAINIKDEALDGFIKTLRNWKRNIAAFADTHITNAVTEGLNNFIRYFKRISFGLPSFEHLRLRVLVESS
jgi:transposase